jgi:hypothetical protein
MISAIYKNGRKPMKAAPVGAYLHSGEDICFFIFIQYLCIAIYFRLFLLFYHTSLSQDPKNDSIYFGIGTYSSEKNELVWCNSG